MKKFKQMPDNAVPKEWAPDDREPAYKTAFRVIKAFNYWGRVETFARPAVALALVECAPVPIVARWALGALALGAYGFVHFKLWGVRSVARGLEDVNPSNIKVKEAPPPELYDNEQEQPT